MTGPALRHVENRLLNDEGLDKQWLYAWIRNSSAVIKSGDSYANRIYAEYNRSAMTAYPQLSDADIENIQGVELDEEMVVTMCYIAECFTFGREPDLDNIDIEYQRKHILDVFLSLLKFK